jgi:S-adenosylmethionine hydrolase
MPLVTFTSDLGMQQYILLGAKAKLLTAFEGLQILDITHELKPFNLQQSVYVFKQCYRLFPAGSFHFLLQDLYASKSKQLLYVNVNQQHIFCADNGFLTMCFDDQPLQIFKLDETPIPYNIQTVVETFINQMNFILHQNDIGLLNVNVNEIIVMHANKAVQRDDELDAQVLHIDRFGNVVLNVTLQQFEQARAGRNFSVVFMRNEEITKLSEHYYDVPPNEKLCYFNVAGYLELAVNKGSAADLFGFRETGDRSLFYHHIKIKFT